MKKCILTIPLMVCSLCISSLADSAVRDSLSLSELYDLIYSQNTASHLSPIEKHQKLMEYFGYAPDMTVTLAATYYNKAGDYEKALECRTRAIELNPSHSGYYIARAATYASLKQDKLAENDYEKAISIDPQDATAYSERAHFLFNRKRYSEAENDYLRLLEFDPEQAGYLYWYGRVLFEQDEYEKALQWYSKSLESGTATTLYRSLAYRGRARTYDALGKYDNALSDFDASIKISPKEILKYYFKADLLRKTKRFEEATAVCQEALSIEPDNQTLLALLKRIHQEQASSDEKKVPTKHSTLR